MSSSRIASVFKRGSDNTRREAKTLNPHSDIGFWEAKMDANKFSPKFQEKAGKVMKQLLLHYTINKELASKEGKK
jgi:hypothetical protein